MRARIQRLLGDGAISTTASLTEARRRHAVAATSDDSSRLRDDASEIGDLGMSVKISPEAAAEILEKISQVSYSMGFSGGLRPAQWNALRYFGKSENSVRTVGHFAKFNMTTPSSASQTINALVMRNILKRSPVSGDRRTYRVDLTETGRRLLEHDPLHHLVEAIAEMPEHHRFDFAEHLQFLLQRMLERASNQ